MKPDNVNAFIIKSTLKPPQFGDLMKFMHRTLILPFPLRFRKVIRTVQNGDQFLSFQYILPQTSNHIDIQIQAGTQIEVEMTPSDQNVPEKALTDMRLDLEFVVKLFEEQIRVTSLYFAWVQGEKGIPEKKAPPQRSFIRRMFADSMLPFFVLFTFINIILFLFIGFLAVFFLLAFQFIIVLFSGKIIARTGDWRVTQENPYVHLFQYQLPYEEYEKFLNRYPRAQLARIKDEIYQQTLAQGKPVECETVEKNLAKYGFECNSENTSMKEIDVYKIVKTVADKFDLPVPRIVISNTVIPNAAASGPSPGQGVIVLTTGLLLKLNEKEIMGVVGHEFSHLRARDPLTLFALSSGEFVLRLYIFFAFPLIFFVFPLLAWIYIFSALSFVYFLAKFLEGRADLESAKMLGEPKVLAEALRKIGFRRLQMERIHVFRLREWTGWNPHPPLYFRIGRLENLEEPEKIKYPLLRSIRDNVAGFYRAFRRRG